MKHTELLEFQSVKNWNIYGNRGKGYTELTIKTHLRYLRVWLAITNLNPDELATYPDLSNIRNKIAQQLRRVVSFASTLNRINALNEFWRANKRNIDDPYEGVGGKLRKDIDMRKNENVGKRAEDFGEEDEIGET